MKLVNFVTRANNLGLDSTTIFVTASGVFFPRNIVYVILQTWNLGASFSICGKVCAVNWDSSIFPRLLFPFSTPPLLPPSPLSFPSFLFSRLPENSTLDHGYSTVASFLSTAHSAKSRLGSREKSNARDFTNWPIFFPRPSRIRNKERLPSFSPFFASSLSLSLSRWWTRGQEKSRYSREQVFFFP